MPADRAPPTVWTMTSPTPVFDDGARVQAAGDIALSSAAWISQGQTGTVVSWQETHDPPTDPDNPPPTYLLYRVAFDLGLTADVRESELAQVV